jgi:hypothetical protein
MPVILPVVKNRCPWAALTALALAAAVGCGGKKMCPVEGRVIYKDGAPCTWGLVIFEPLGEPDLELKVSARGHIQKDGSFRMSTYSEYDGVPEGRYRVLITPLIGVPGASGTPIHVKYRRPETSPLEYTVVPGKNQVIFEMDRPSPSQRKDE